MQRYRTHLEQQGRAPSAINVRVAAVRKLAKEQAEMLLALPVGESQRARRDRALLGLLVGCGLRCTGLAALTVAHVQ